MEPDAHLQPAPDQLVTPPSSGRPNEGFADEVQGDRSWRRGAVFAGRGVVAGAALAFFPSYSVFAITVSILLADGPHPSWSLFGPALVVQLTGTLAGGAVGWAVGRRRPVRFGRRLALSFLGACGLTICLAMVGPLVAPTFYEEGASSHEPHVTVAFAQGGAIGRLQTADGGEAVVTFQRTWTDSGGLRFWVRVEDGPADAAWALLTDPAGVYLVRVEQWAYDVYLLIEGGLPPGTEAVSLRYRPDPGGPVPHFYLAGGGADPLKLAQ
jgi:hypothetical protein